MSRTRKDSQKLRRRFPARCCHFVHEITITIQYFLNIEQEPLQPKRKNTLYFALIYNPIFIWAHPNPARHTLNGPQAYSFKPKCHCAIDFNHNLHTEKAASENKWPNHTAGPTRYSTHILLLSVYSFSSSFLCPPFNLRRFILSCYCSALFLTAAKFMCPQSAVTFTLQRFFVGFCRMPNGHSGTCVHVCASVFMSFNTILKYGDLAFLFYLLFWIKDSKL